MKEKDKNKSNIDKVNQKINELKKKQNDLKKQVEYTSKSNYRKERARRLIETGALAEKYFELDKLNIADREELFKMFSPFVIGNKPKKFKDKQSNNKQPE